MKEKNFFVNSKNGCTFAPDLKEKSAGVLAQVARAFDWQSKGHEFDSHILHKRRVLKTLLFVYYASLQSINYVNNYFLPCILPINVSVKAC